MMYNRRIHENRIKQCKHGNDINTKNTKTLKTVKTQTATLTKTLKSDNIPRIDLERKKIRRNGNKKSEKNYKNYC